MEQIKPKFESTDHSQDFREWCPSSFESFLAELNHIVDSCEGPDPEPLFRGQTNSEWHLDSTFVRCCIQHLFHISDHHTLPKEVRQSVAFHKTIASLFFLKFGTILKPSQEYFEREKDDGIDPWFELLKNLQQYPDRDRLINGTFLLDWSLSKDIALYFAVYKGKDEERQVSPGHGALWICDAVATGKTLQQKKLGDIIAMMKGDEFLNGNKTFPLLFYPPKQTFQPRSKNQEPFYVAQMDFRYDLADIWAPYEGEEQKRVFIKLIIDENLKNEAAKYLESKDVVERFVYPE